MPARAKRPRGIDPTRSDSDDEDYDNRSTRTAPRARKGPKSSTTIQKSRSAAPARKRRRVGYATSGSDIAEDSDEVAEESYDDSIEEADDADADAPLELGPSGRPVRSAAKNRVRPSYNESDEDSIEEEASDDGFDVKPAKGGGRQKLNVKAPAQPKEKKKKKLITLRVNTEGIRGGSAKATPTDGAPGMTRRSSRIARDESEGLLALTTSGNHVEYARAPTQSPTEATRPVTGVKKPPSAITEVTEESSHRTKAETQEEEAVAATQGLDEAVGDGDEEDRDAQMQDDNDEAAVVLESQEAADDDQIEKERGGDDDAEDDDDDVVVKPKRNTRRKSSEEAEAEAEAEDAALPTDVPAEPSSRTLRSAAPTTSQTTRGRRGKKRGIDDTSDFEPGAEEGGEDDSAVSASESDAESPRKRAGRTAANSQDVNDSSGSQRRSKRLRKNDGRPSTSGDNTSDELALELRDLARNQQGSGRRTRAKARAAAAPPPTQEDRPQRQRKNVDYRLLRPELNTAFDEDATPIDVTPSKRGRGGAGIWGRTLLPTYGPFGGGAGPGAALGGPGAAGGADSDSSDDDAGQRAPRSNIGGAVGMTPTGGAPGLGGILGAGGVPPQAQFKDPVQATLGKVKDARELADADPLGVDPTVSFDAVGGLEGHIDHLKEMVALPLLYPEIFQRFKVTPPRGVLFHGPPGTGKTLLARALASSVSTQGRKVTFYMRKGADALSKWVGEAERQLRLLFEEARKTQPSIIFFDEIDGLAPVRSSKQDQIHSSIVSTLLALMDGMDGRGQVIVIGATNRPDSIDPALRRPGRFDREFYFPLPNKDARRKILDIHTRGWEPPLDAPLKDELAEVTKGYGGADLRALCTEAALNAVQRRYPQIYASNEKLLIKPETISVSARDFMISVKKMVPSSERSAASGAAPLPASVEPLLRTALRDIEALLADVLPRKKKLNALEEAQYEDATGAHSMRSELMAQAFERSRVFRPRLLVRGLPGLGQQYLAGALLHHFEGFHVQSFDQAVLLGDATRSAEAAIIQLFTEVRRHKPSVIYVPHVDSWWNTIGETARSTFVNLLRSVPPTDPILLLGVLESRDAELEAEMVRELFGYSKRNKFELLRPTSKARLEYFRPVVEYINTSPEQFPDPAQRKKRQLEVLPPAPPEAPKENKAPTKEEMRQQRKNDRYTLSVLKRRIQPIMDQIRNKYKKFRTGVVPEEAIRYLLEEQDPVNVVQSDMPNLLRAQTDYRQYRADVDEHGEPGLIENASDRFFYNMETVTIEKRLSNGYYKRPRDFLADIKKITKDAKAAGDPERLLRANELQSNVEVDVRDIELGDPQLTAECEAVYRREKERERAALAARDKAQQEGRPAPDGVVSNVPPEHGGSTTQTSDNGAILLGQPHGTALHQRVATTTGTGAPFSASASAPAAAGPHSTPLTNGVSSLSDLSRPARPRSSHGAGTATTNGDVHMADPHEPLPPQHDSNHTDTTNANNTTPVAERAPHDSGSSFGPSAQTRPPHMHTGAPASLQQRMSLPGSLSQRSALTPLAPGAEPGMYENSASTTSSDRRMTGSTGAGALTASSQALHQQLQDAAAGKGGAGDAGGDADDDGGSNRADISMLLQPVESAGDPQMPDTQEQAADADHSSVDNSPSQRSHALASTQPSSGHSVAPTNSNSNHTGGSSQVPPVPLFSERTSDVHALLNAEDGEAPARRTSVSAAAAAPAHPPLTSLEPHMLEEVLRHLAERTSGCSVEQLEQVHSALMNEIWRSRGDWDRAQVAEECCAVLEDVLRDMHEMQSVQPPSFENQRQQLV